MKIKTKRMFIFITLFVLMISSYFIVGSLGKYKSNVIASGSTPIAKWEVLYVSENYKEINLTSGGESINYLLDIISNSDVAANYSVIISNLPDSVKISFDNSEYVSPINGVIEFNDCGSINVNEKGVLKRHTLSFKAIRNLEEVNNKRIEIDVNFVQKEI